MRVLFLLFAALGCSSVFAQPPEPARDGPDDEPEDVLTMAAFNVNADRVEDFGLRVRPQYDPSRSSMFWPVRTVLVTAVVPNTAAAKAGMRPGEFIVKSDGQSTASTIFSRNKWLKLQQRKWAEVASGKKNVTWTLEIQSPGAKETRTVKLVVPTPAPHWGAPLWQLPEGRAPAVVEPGPLAERSRVVLDNGVWLQIPPGTVRPLALEPDARRPFLGYQWALSINREAHRISVSQQRGRTDIILETTSPETGSRFYLTSPAGALEKTWQMRRGARSGEVPLEEARAGFQQEMDFWLTKVDRVTARWPLELVAGKTGAVVEGNVDPARAAVIAMGTRGDSFLKLPPASEAQRALFADAFGKIGADENRWAYTETSRGLDDKRVMVMRVDPSKPEAERSMLLKMDGKPPTEADVKRWREQGRDSSAALGELPPISSVVDLDDVRVLAEETAAIVFELPLRGGSKEFPADKFQAVFRVNKTQRGFEDFAVKLRESFRVAGVVKISEAGLAVRFQTFDPASPPQPVSLKAGGAVSLLFVKFSRSFEATRTDFRRVEPYAEDSSK